MDARAAYSRVSLRLSGMIAVGVRNVHSQLSVCDYLEGTHLICKEVQTKPSRFAGPGSLDKPAAG